jgi:Spy/CpxP family protein refolding chaperone
MAAKFAQPPIVKLVTANVARWLLLKAELGLTEQQRSAIMALAEARRSKRAPVAAAAIQKKRALREAVLADKPDAAAIRAAAMDLGKAIGDAAVAASEGIAQGRNILTPEQRDKIRACLAACDSAEDAWLKELATP